MFRIVNMSEDAIASGGTAHITTFKFADTIPEGAFNENFKNAELFNKIENEENFVIKRGRASNNNAAKATGTAGVANVNRHDQILGDKELFYLKKILEKNVTKTCIEIFGKGHDCNPSEEFIIMPRSPFGDLRTFTDGKNEGDKIDLKPSFLHKFSSFACELTKDLEKLNVVHLDIKPENILLFASEGGPRFVLTDFGSAREANIEIKHPENFNIGFSSPCVSHLHETIIPEFLDDIVSLAYVYKWLDERTFSKVKPEDTQLPFIALKPCFDGLCKKSIDKTILLEMIFNMKTLVQVNKITSNVKWINDALHKIYFVKFAFFNKEDKVKKLKSSH